VGAERGSRWFDAGAARARVADPMCISAGELFGLVREAAAKLGAVVLAAAPGSGTT
jgi:hypothetical protein